jgi:hypothetical protein
MGQRQTRRRETKLKREDFLAVRTELVTISLVLSKYNYMAFYNKQGILECKVNQGISLFH